MIEIDPEKLTLLRKLLTDRLYYLKSYEDIFGSSFTSNKSFQYDTLRIYLKHHINTLEHLYHELQVIEEAILKKEESASSPEESLKLQEEIRLIEENLEQGSKLHEMLIEQLDEFVLTQYNLRGIKFLKNVRQSSDNVIQRKRKNEEFDVFLVYNHIDREEVEAIARELKKKEILPWFDRWELEPGTDWEETLRRALEKVKAVAIFIGKDENSPWEEVEMRSFLRDSVRKGLPVIPVILESADADVAPRLPIFLEDRQWVDFRENSGTALLHLIGGISGKKLSL